MEKIYEKPIALILEMGGEDIIQTSGLSVGEDDSQIGDEGSNSGTGGIIGIGKTPIGFKTPGKFI